MIYANVCVRIWASIYMLAYMLADMVATSQHVPWHAPSLSGILSLYWHSIEWHSRLHRSAWSCLVMQLGIPEQIPVRMQLAICLPTAPSTTPGIVSDTKQRSRCRNFFTSLDDHNAVASSGFQELLGCPCLHALMRLPTEHAARTSNGCPLRATYDVILAQPANFIQSAPCDAGA